MLFQEDKPPGEILNFLLPQECRNSVALPKLLGANLFVTGLFTLLFGVYSVCVTLLTGILVGLPGLPPLLVWRSGIQIVAAAFTIYLVCMSMILIFGQLRGAYLVLLQN